MNRTVLHLGRTPLMRRVVAALILSGAAIALAVTRSDGPQMWVELGAGLLASAIALLLLHLRWSARERRLLSPGKARDVFS